MAVDMVMLDPALRSYPPPLTAIQGCRKQSPRDITSRFPLAFRRTLWVTTTEEKAEDGKIKGTAEQEGGTKAKCRVVSCPIPTAPAWGAGSQQRHGRL